MASSINASTAGAGGVITTADNSGVLNLQSGGNTVATVQSTGFSLPASATINAANTFGFKNRIINGGMVIDQRNAGASVTPATSTVVYTLDRWNAYQNVASKFSVQQNAGSVTPPAGFTNYLGATSLSAYTVTGTNEFDIAQYIEGYNVADLGWGTANAKTVTISAWVRSSLTGTFGGSVGNANSTRTYPFTYSIPTANTWTQISVTIAGDTTGTWNTTTGIGINLNFSLGAGATRSGTAGTWDATNYTSATGAVSVVGTSGATFYITGVQLEVGSQATSFDFRSHGTELALCQRYFEKSYNLETAVGTATSIGTYYPIVAGNTGTSNYGATLRYCVNKRTAATFTSWDTAGNAGKCATDTQGTNQTLNISGGGQSTSPVLYTSGLNNPTALNFQWSASAEL
jgi:hypothetical protein